MTKSNALLPGRYDYHIPSYWHVLTWLAIFSYLSLGDYLLGQTVPTTMWWRASFLLASGTEFYFCYLILYPRLLQTGRLKLLAAGLVVATLLFTGVRYGLDEVLYKALLGYGNYSSAPTPLYYLGDNLYYALPMLAVSAALWAGQAVLRREKENKLIATERKVAELAFLKAQINPHFLYNTLNMLYGMAYRTEGPLADGLLQLAALMRYMLNDTSDDLVSISEEISYINNYLSLYRLRYSQQFCAELLVEGDADGHRILPLLLIPFVENALKHGVLDDPATPILLQLRLQKGVIEFTVKNQCHDYEVDVTSGIGLINLQRRLALRYHERYSLRLEKAENMYNAYLRVEDDT